MKRWLVAFALACALVAATVPAARADIVGENVVIRDSDSDTVMRDLDVVIEPTDVAAVLGESIELTITVTNQGDTATPPVAVHLDVTDPTTTGSVDPEDWTATLTQQIGEMAPGQVEVLTWTIQPIAPGTFSAYAIALSPTSSSLAASAVVQIDVADHRSLNPGGILPVALGTPALVGALLIWRLRVRRRGM